MIHFYYSATGEYNIQTFPDVSESMLVDRTNNKIVLFGEQEFYFSTLSDLCSSTNQDSSIGLSQKGGYVILSSLDTKIDAVNSSVNTKFNSTIQNLNTSINAVNTSVNTKFNSTISTLNTSINAINTSVNNKFNSMITSLNTSINNTSTYLVNTMNTSVNNAMSLINASVNASINSLLTKINNANSSINSIDASVKWIIEVYQPELERTWADIFYFLNASMGIANGSINRIEQLISALDMQTTNDRLDAIDTSIDIINTSIGILDTSVYDLYNPGA
jgi:hypothetical protein